jgi:hypothetical protein
MNDNISQFLRIIPSARLDDRFLTALHITPEDSSKEAMGEAYVLVEITRPWFPVSQIGSRIVTTFKKAYYSGESSSDLVNFEKAVKKVNEMLLSLTEQGETEWIGHLNAIIGILINKEVHITSAGLAQAYLFRDGKVSYITEKQTANEPHPLKTFGSIISGTLLVEDAILMATPELSNITDLSTLKGFFEESSAYNIGSQLLKLIKKQKKKALGSIIVKLTTKSLSATHEPEVLYTDQIFKEKTLALKQTWQNNILPLLLSFSQKVVSLVKISHSHTKEKIIPATKVAATKIVNQTNSSLNSAWSKTKPIVDKQSQKIASTFDSALTGIKDKKDTTHIGDNSAESIIGKSIFTINDYQEEIRNNEKSKLGLKKDQAKRAYLFLWLRLIKTFRKMKEPKNRPLLLVTGAIILIILLIISISIQRHNKGQQVATSKQEETLSQANDKLNEGKTNLANNQTAKAEENFGQAVSLATTLQNTPLKNRANSIIKASQNESDKITGTTRLQNLQPLTVIEGNSFDVINAKSYSINSKGEIYESGLIADAISAKISKLPKDDTDVSSTTTSDNGTLFINTKKQNLYEFNPESQEVKKISPANGENLPVATAMRVFSNTLYMLDTKNNQIWKYPISDSNLAARSGYMKDDSIKLADAVDFSIDGSIFVVFKDGHIINLSRGTKTDFKLADIPKSYTQMNNANKIYTDPDATSVYVLDTKNKRILEYSKNGQFNHQYILEDKLTKIESFIIQPKGSTGYIINDKKLYQLEL